jgi:hypothetical protein
MEGMEGRFAGSKGMGKGRKEWKTVERRRTLKGRIWKAGGQEKQDSKA